MDETSGADPLRDGDERAIDEVIEAQQAALREAIEITGNASRLAAAIVVSPQFMTQLVKGERRVPPKKALAIERTTGVRCWRLRAGDWWEHWPHLIGTPGAPAVPTPEAAPAAAAQEAA